MPNTDGSLHQYERVVKNDRNDSLSIIASLIKPGQSVLDLGMGAGSLGQFLSQRGEFVGDGVSLNPAEAETARAWYRQVFVADLDQDLLAPLLGGKTYDCIVCADVLEHLKAPQAVLSQCLALLKPGGRLLTSVPNAGYCGLIAELMQGDFRYRPEGLLDQTHLRFFTRRSLRRFFAENGWAVNAIETTQRTLIESEFKVAFDSLPPSVSRHLLALPDAMSYQFVSELTPVPTTGDLMEDPSDADLDSSMASAPSSALFSAEVYLASGGDGYLEESKLVSAGQIGSARQTLGFDIPANLLGYARIRLDPADRPGFFRLHHLSISLPDGEVLWQWRVEEDSLDVLENSPKQQILLSPPWETTAGALLLLYGDDPWVELPIDSTSLSKIARLGARLEMGVGWPMSADYIQASNAISQRESAYDKSSALQQAELSKLHHLKAELESSQERLQTRLGQLNNLIGESREEKRRLVSEMRSSQGTHAELQAQLSELIAHLNGIEASTVFRVSRPLVHLKMRIDKLLGRVAKESEEPRVREKARTPSHPLRTVDIIVPVYRGIEDTRCCLESVLSAKNLTDWRLIVINDCSPETEVTEWLRDFAKRDSRIELLENAENLGFVGTVNRGMALSDANDVILLNSDAEVANDWLDRIQRAAFSAPRVASVTPFSNNATIFSYPRFCKSNEMPAGHDVESLDRVFATQLAGQVLEVPTGVGFCMYIKRECLQEVGFFDEENFGKGYGEENDFCVRAQQAGWIHLHALDTFVRHAGGISFGESKSVRELQALETLRRLHPRYEIDVHAFVRVDPASAARLTVDIARITSSRLPVILNVMHDREGGTLRHAQELAEYLAGEATFLRLSPAPNGVELRLEGVHEAFAVQFSLPAQHPELLRSLRSLQVSHIHYHHLLGHSVEMANLPAQLGVTHDFTAHDYYSYCPQISLTDHTDRYCGEKGLDQCRQCLRRNPAPGGENIESWRARHAKLLSEARFVIAPSADVAHRMSKFVPTANVQVVPHSKLETHATPLPRLAQPLLDSTRPLKVVVLGALSKIKGADILEDVAILAARLKVPVEFHLLGYAYRNLRTQPKAALTVHGQYDDRDLPQLLQWLQPDVVWFPAVWPETYSYTLSASLDSGLPIIASDIGAFSERLQHREWTWLCNYQQSTGAWVDFFTDIRATNFCTGVGPSAAAPLLDPTPIADQELDYHGGYLESLRPSDLQSAEDLVDLQDELTLLQQACRDSRPPSSALKLMALRVLLRMRSSRVFAPLVKSFPMHLQRKMKSYLGS